MPKRIVSWFYRISISMISIFILSNILVKTVIWSSALEEKTPDKYQYPITIIKDIPRARYKYTTEMRQKFFNKVDYLLTPAFTLLFAVIAVRLIKIPGIFKEQN